MVTFGIGHHNNCNHPHLHFPLKQGGDVFSDLQNPIDISRSSIPLRSKSMDRILSVIKFGQKTTALKPELPISPEPVCKRI